MAEPAVFCDFVQVTVPVDGWPELREAVQPVLDSAGLALAHEAPNGDVLWRDRDTGSVKATRRGQVVALGASGAVLAGMRMLGLLHTYLAELGARHHRVTRLDLSMDVPEDTAPVIARLRDEAVSGDGVKLSRKRVLPQHVTRFVSRRPDGEDTGTIYLGSHQADVRLCVYDKRVERLARDMPDVGPLTRYELRLRGGTGITLRDAADPAPAFWHYIAPDVLPRRDGVPEWDPQGTGFVLAPADLPLPAERLRRRVQASAELRSLVELADRCGPYGFALMVSEMRKLVAVGDGDRPTCAGIGEAPALIGPPASDQPAPAPLH